MNSSPIHTVQRTFRHGQCSDIIARCYQGFRVNVVVPDSESNLVLVGSQNCHKYSRNFGMRTCYHTVHTKTEFYFFSWSRVERFVYIIQLIQFNKLSMLRLLEQSGRIRSSRKSLVTRVRRTSAFKLFPVKKVSKREYQQQVLKRTRCGAAR